MNVGKATPRVSIGLPVYNGQRYLAEAIESLLAQSFTDFELIISDNASQDATESICRKYAAQDDRIRYDRQDRNRGAAWNFNQVFRLATGSYFKWAAYDDLHAESYLAECVARLDHGPDVSWCHSRSSHFAASGKLLAPPAVRDISYLAPRTAEGRSGDRGSADPCQRFAAVVLSQGGCLDIYGVFRRCVLEGTMLHLPYYGAEKVLLGEMALRGRYCEVPETLFYFRVHLESSGGLANARDQILWEDTEAVPWRTFTRWQLFLGHWRAALRAPLGRRQRLRCLGTVGMYLLQFRKYKEVIRRTLRGQGTGGGSLGCDTDVIDATPDVVGLSAGRPAHRRPPPTADVATEVQP